MAKKSHTAIAKPTDMGSGFQHQAGAGPPCCRGPAALWLACPYGGGGTQFKGLLSQQMASGLAITTPNLRVGESSLRLSCHHRHTKSYKENKTKQNSSAALYGTRCPEPAEITAWARSWSKPCTVGARAVILVAWACAQSNVQWWMSMGRGGHLALAR